MTIVSTLCLFFCGRLREAFPLGEAEVSWRDKEGEAVT